MATVAVLVVVWIVALLPMVVRRLSDRDFNAGIRAHHRLMRLSGRMGGVEEAGTSDGRLSASRPLSSARAVPATSPAMATRRRRVMSVLLASTVLLFLLGVIPGAHLLWDVALILLACTLAYVALLVHFNRLAIEKAQKIVALETRRHATETLQQRRQVVASGGSTVGVGSDFSPDGYPVLVPAASYAASVGYGDASFYTPAPVLMKGSGWSVPATQPHRRNLG
jgi:membrane protein implicated in regulation of membrane protease activity